jgi:hypothetical protein
VRVGTDEDVLPEDGGMPGASADQSVLHDHGPGADLDLAVFGGQDGPEEHARVGADADIAAQHCRRRYVRVGVNAGGLASVSQQHATTLAEHRQQRSPCATEAVAHGAGSWSVRPRHPRRTSGRTRTIITTLCTLWTAMLTSALR